MYGHGTFLVEIRVAEGRHLVKCQYGRDVDGANVVDDSEKAAHKISNGSFLPNQTQQKKPPQLLNPGLTVSLSLSGEHSVTEQCNDSRRPSWSKISKFRYQFLSPLSWNGSNTPVDDFFQSPTFVANQLYGSPWNNDSASGLNSVERDRIAAVTEEKSSQSSISPKDFSFRSYEWSKEQVLRARNDALHVRAFQDSVVSKKMIGDVVIDMSVLLRSGGKIISSDRIGCHSEHLNRKILESYDQSTINNRTSQYLLVETWVPLRQGSGELLLQIFVKPDLSFIRSPIIIQNNVSAECSKSSNLRTIQRMDSSFKVHKNIEPNSVFRFFDCESDPDCVLIAKENDHLRNSSSNQIKSQLSQYESFSSAEQSSFRRNTFSDSPPASISSKSNTPNRKINRHRRCCPWASFDFTSIDNVIVVGLPLWIKSLVGRLISTEEQYCYSYAYAYSQTLPGEEYFKESDLAEVNRFMMNQVIYSSKLQLEMLHIIIQGSRQREAWAKCLVSYNELREAIKNPPTFRAFMCHQRGSGGRGGVRLQGTANTPIFDLVLGGIPSSLFGENCGVHELVHGFKNDESEIDNSGTAFGGSVADPLCGVKTFIPSVEVVRVSGHLCCAEYAIHISLRDGQSWTVFRRYSDFNELYEALPGLFTSLMAPLPPKSWRSFSHLTMSPEFLEERRDGLETALRRLLQQCMALRNGVHAFGSDVAELVRSFLGMPPQPESLGGGLLWSVLPELELNLYSKPEIGSNLSSRYHNQTVHLAEDLRLSMWLILSGAAHAAREATERGLRGYFTVNCSEKEEIWLSFGGSKVDWENASRHFEAIDVDVNRTYVKSDSERESLRRVLRSFALQLPDVGYCQAMNFVALFLIRTCHGREDVSFLLLWAIAANVVPRYWEGTTCMAFLHTDLAVLRALAQTHMNQLVTKLNTIGLPIELLICDWMLSLFCRVLPPITVLRVWDWLFLEGADVLIFVALAILRYAEEDMMEVSGACASADKLTAIASEIHNADELIDLAVRERDIILSSEGSLKRLRAEQTNPEHTRMESPPIARRRSSHEETKGKVHSAPRCDPSSRNSMRSKAAVLKSSNEVAPLGIVVRKSASNPFVSP